MVSKLAPKTSPRPKKRPADIEAMGAVDRGNRSAMAEGADTQALKAFNGVQKKAKGGMCRGMGAATRGGKYTKAG